MDHRSAKMYVAVFAVLMAMAGTMAWFGPEHASADEGAGELRHHVEENLIGSIGRGGTAVPGTVLFLKTHCNCSRDANDWALVAVRPDNVALIRREILRRANQAGRRDIRTATFIKSDADLLGAAAGARPEWWTPTKLRDAEIVAIGDLGGTVYVFSEKTGTIYIMSWSV